MFKYNKITVISIITGLGVAASQFYVLESGLPQPAHFLIFFAFIFFLLIYKKFNISHCQEFAPRLLLAFVLYQALVNLSYASLTLSTSFIMQAVYIFYGYMTFLLILNLALRNPNSIDYLAKFACIGLFILFVIAVFGLGDYYFYPRYNAFFNDPNQMAYWVLCICAIIIIYFNRVGSFLLPGLVFLVSTYLLFLTASRSGLLGFSLLLLGFLLLRFGSGLSKIKLRHFVLFLLSILIIVIGAGYILRHEADLMQFLLGRLLNADFADQADIRGYTRIVEYPAYLIFGAGHGLDIRFTATGGEIHSTWAGLLFYYGIVGFLLFIPILFSIFKRLSLGEALIFLAPMMYSFATFGLRTPIFWIFLGFFYALVISKQRRSSKQSDQHFLNQKTLNTPLIAISKFNAAK